MNYSHDIPGGAAYSLRLRAGSSVTLTALGDGVNVSTLIFGSDLLDRLNVPDTLKAQMSARIQAPMVLMSDRGLAMASVVSSSLEWHDALCGFSAPSDLERFGAGDYQSDRNQWRRSARELLLIELFKHGLGAADLHGSVNFFSKVVAADDAWCSLAFEQGHSAAGDSVTLLAEQDLLILFATSPHPLDPAVVWNPAGVRLDVGGPVSHTTSYQFRAESARALDQTQKVFS